MSNPLPDFVDLPGNIIPHIPYVSANALMQGGFVAGDRGKIQAMVDQVLNAPSGGRLSFTAVTNLVLVSALYCPHLTSSFPPDRARGFAAESDVGFWVLVLGGPVDNIAAWSMRWLPIYLFVDTGVAMASGREVFGFPKSLGAVTRAGTDDKDGRVSVSTLLYRHFGPEQKAEMAPLFALVKGQGASSSGVFAGLDHFLTHVANAMVGGFETIVHEALDLTGFKLPMVGLPCIFLKQFRDATAQGKACYQAVIEANIAATTIHDFGILDGDYQVAIQPAANYPMADDMGLAPVQDLLFPFWLRQDFTMGFGTAI
jgi:hypothetical protein